jgi:hypothetical protein
MLPRIPGLAALGLAVVLATMAPGQGEPRPGTVAGLDLASPESAAESFVRAWSAGDYFVAYLALDPELRFRFMEAIYRLDFPAVFGQGHSEPFFDRLPAMTAENRFPGSAPGIPPDRFAEFDGFMRTARAVGIPILSFDAAALGEMSALPDGGDSALARVPVASAAGGGILVLRRSPEGRWRLLGIEKRAVPALWQYRAG